MESARFTGPHMLRAWSWHEMCLGQVRDMQCAGTGSRNTLNPDPARSESYIIPNLSDIVPDPISNMHCSFAAT